MFQLYHTVTLINTILYLALNVVFRFINYQKVFEKICELFLKEIPTSIGILSVPEQTPSLCRAQKSTINSFVFA